MRGFRIGVSGKGFTQGQPRLPPFLCGGIAPPQRRSATPPNAEKPPERRDAARPSLEHQNAAQPQTSQRRTSPSANAALHFPKRQDAVHPTKTLHTPPRHCAAHQDAALLQVPQCYAPPNIAALRIPQMAKARRCSLFGYENVRTIAAFMPKFPAFIPNMPPRAPSDGEHRRVFAKSKPPRAA